MALKVSIDPLGFVPERAHATDAGLDFRSPASLWIHPGEHVKVNTFVHVAVPDGYVGLITSKSGLMAKGLTCRGTIDAGYTGPIHAVLYNHGPEGYCIERGDKICQLVLIPIITPELEIVDTLEATERGAGGFGSTGR